MSGSGGGIGRREVAVRCFAAEYDDASLEYSESDEERAPNYVVTPTGARVNRLFVVGVLTEVESVSDDVLRARVVDPTGAFVVYAGQYQPDAKTFLERAEPPQFVAVTGKARTFEPDDADTVYTSVRPESINAVDPETRDRWTVQTAEFTVDRVATFAAALSREERGEALREALVAAGVDPALAAGIPRAVDHYGTTEAYLAAVRETALQAAEVVAGEREEVEPLEIAPGEGGDVDVDLTGGIGIEAAAGQASTASMDAAAASTGEPSAETVEATTEAATAETDTDTEAETDTDAATEPEGATPEPEVEPTATAESEGSRATAGTADEAEADEPSTAGADGTGGDDDLGDFDDFGADDGGAEEEVAGASEAATGEMYEMDDEEREAVEEEFGTEFSTGSEVEGAGEADIETPGPVDGSDEGAGDEGAEPAAEEPTDEEAPEEGAVEAEEAPEAEAVESEEAHEAEAVDAEGTPEEAAEPEEVDLQDAVVDAMADLDEGEGADREAVVQDVADEHGADRESVEDAIQDALMGGRCYEPEDGRLKAI